MLYIGLYMKFSALLRRKDIKSSIDLLHSHVVDYLAYSAVCCSYMHKNNFTVWV
jgi:hypothetical protein